MSTCGLRVYPSREELFIEAVSRLYHLGLVEDASELSRVQHAQFDIEGAKHACRWVGKLREVVGGRRDELDYLTDSPVFDCARSTDTMLTGRLRALNELVDYLDRLLNLDDLVRVAA